MKTPLPYETYTAMKRLKQEDIWYECVSPYHLKVDAYNFYPKRGIIHIDGEPDAVSERGVEVFIKLLKDDAPVMARLRHKGEGRTSSSPTANTPSVFLKLE